MSETKNTYKLPAKPRNLLKSGERPEILPQGECVGRPQAYSAAAAGLQLHAAPGRRDGGYPEVSFAMDVRGAGQQWVHARAPRRYRVEVMMERDGYYHSRTMRVVLEGRTLDLIAGIPSELGTRRWRWEKVRYIHDAPTQYDNHRLVCSLVLDASRSSSSTPLAQLAVSMLLQVCRETYVDAAEVLQDVAEAPTLQRPLSDDERAVREVAMQVREAILERRSLGNRSTQ